MSITKARRSTAAKKKRTSTKRRTSAKKTTKRSTKAKRPSTKSKSVSGIKVVSLKQVEQALANYRKKLRTQKCGSGYKKSALVRRKFIMKLSAVARWRKIVRARGLRGPILFTKATPGKVHVHMFSGGCRPSR